MTFLKQISTEFHAWQFLDNDLEDYFMNGETRAAHFRAAFAGIIQRTWFAGQMSRKAY